jgi:hypothetical protein
MISKSGFKSLMELLSLQEGFLEVVIGLCGDVVVLEILLPMESDGLGLDFSFLHIDLVASEDNWDVFADTDEITYNSCEIMTRGRTK